MLGAAGLFALQNNADRLAIDHANAKRVGDALSKKFGAETVACATNMLHLKLPEDRYAELAKQLLHAGIKVARPRWVFHLDISEQDLEAICEAIAGA